MRASRLSNLGAKADEYARLFWLGFDSCFGINGGSFNGRMLVSDTSHGGSSPTSNSSREKNMMTTKLKPYVCPVCGTAMNAATSLENETPSKDDLIICSLCPLFFSSTPTSKFRDCQTKRSTFVP